MMHIARFRSFQPTVSLPLVQEMALGDTMTQSANAAVLHKVQTKQPGKCKAHMAFTAEQRATLGKYTSKHRSEIAVKNFETPYMCN